MKFRKLPKENTYADQLKIVFNYYSIQTQLAQIADVITAQAKRIYIIMIKVFKQLFFMEDFLKEIENKFSECLSSYIETL